MSITIHTGTSQRFYPQNLARNVNKFGQLYSNSLQRTAEQTRIQARADALTRFKNSHPTRSSCHVACVAIALFGTMTAALYLTFGHLSR